MMVDANEKPDTKAWADLTSCGVRNRDVRPVLSDVTRSWDSAKHPHHHHHLFHAHTFIIKPCMRSIAHDVQQLQQQEQQYKVLA